MSVAGGGERRIVLDTDDLRRVATRMRGASLMLSVAGRELASRPMPSMPTGVGSAVTEAVSRANAELQDLALELLQEAGMLSSRATWAELGGGDAVAWMIPGLQHVPSGFRGPQAVTPTSLLSPVTEEQIIRSERWAASRLSEMQESPQLLDDRPDQLGDELDDAFGRDLVRFAHEHADEVPIKTLGEFTVDAGVGLELYEHHREGMAEAAAVSAGVAATAGGAVGVALPEVALGWTGAGLVGCLVVGGAAGGRPGDQTDDEVSH